MSQRALSKDIVALQMKERYTTARPYGEWLEQETVSLQQLVDSVPAELRVSPPVVPAAPIMSKGASSNGNGAAASVRAALSCTNSLRTFVAQLMISSQRLSSSAVFNAVLALL